MDQITTKLSSVPAAMELVPADAWTSSSVALFSIIAFIAGSAATYIFLKNIKSNESNSNDLQKKLDKSNQRLKSYQQEVSEHFIAVSHLTNNVTQSYREIHEHLVGSAIRLASPEIGRQLLKSRGSDLALLDPDGNRLIGLEDVEVPRDYAPKVPGGILSEGYGLKDSDPEDVSKEKKPNIDNLAFADSDPTENVG